MTYTTADIDFNIADLWSFATGGTRVADRPAAPKTKPIPLGPRAAGVSATMEWFSGLRSKSQIPLFLFLIGGPGAGKSSAVSELVKGMERLDRQDERMAHRTYEFRSADGALRLVNDATVPKKDVLEPHLQSDINECLDASVDLVACVNRGILVEELQVHIERENPGHLISQWLHNHDAEAIGTADGWRITAEDGLEQPFLRMGTLFMKGERRAHVAAVFMDACSLLEAQPEAIFKTDGSLSITNQYEVTLLSKRAQLKPDTIPAGSLLDGVVDALSGNWDGPYPPEMDPIRANLSSLASEGVRSGLLTLLRSAEIVSGQRLSYRELWGATVRSLVGDLPEVIDAQEVHKHLRELVTVEGESAEERFESMMRLARWRFSEALFAQPMQDSPESLNPLVSITSMVDPLLDAVPGDNLTKPYLGWATPITDAFSGAVLEESPLESLAQQHAVASSPGFQAVTSFDWHLDKTYMDVIRTPGLRRPKLQRYVSWYGRYLLRFLAVANGIPAFAREIEAWTLAWQLSPILPSEDPLNLERSFETLIRPPRDPVDSGSRRLLPIFESRTMPIQGSSQKPRVSLATEKMNPSTIRIGENLLVALNGFGSATVELNFPLLREALAHANGQFGISEMAPVASPRLDRLRAADMDAHLIREPSYFIVDGAKEFKFTVRNSA